MARRQKDRIGPADAALWARVKKTTIPLHPFESAQLADKTVPHPDPGTPGPTGFRIAPFELGQSSTALPAMAGPHGGQAVPKMDNKAYQKLRRGRLTPEARLDLHGMTQEAALPALMEFIREAASRGQRLVLVITGKGRPRPEYGPIPERSGVLRRNVPMWLHSGGSAALVLDVVEAHQGHGGAGAFYVYLRRRR